MFAFGDNIECDMTKYVCIFLLLPGCVTSNDRTFCPYVLLREIAKSLTPVQKGLKEHEWVGPGNPSS